jgi:thiol-disulfide isomerase/thioredoxin
VLAFKLRYFAAAVLGAALVLAGCSSSDPVKAAAVKPAAERKQAPDFSLKDSYGRTLKLSDYKGKVILLDFWATWCGPCKIEIPWFIEFERKYKDQGFAVIGVAMDDEGWQVVNPFVSDLGINYRIVEGNDSVAQLFGGVEALPTTFLIDRLGRIAAVHVGLASKGDFEDGIRQLLDTP